MNDKGNLTNHTIEKLDSIGTVNTQEYSSVLPIINSEQTGIAGKKGSIRRKYVGHVVYSPDLEATAYQIQRERKHLLDNVEGIGISITESIIQEVKEQYNVEYVLVGIRESGDILIIPVDAFNNNWHTEKYDKQLYARIDNDVEYRLNNSMSCVFSKIPSDSDKSISKQEAIRMSEK